MLPDWIVTKIKPGQFGIECPRSDCHGKAIVNARRWLAQPADREPSYPKFTGRSCPYCFRANAIPEKLRK